MSQAGFSVLTIGSRKEGRARVATFNIGECATMTWDTENMLSEEEWPSADTFGIWDEYCLTHRWSLLAILRNQELWLFQRHNKSAKLCLKFISGNSLEMSNKLIRFEEIRVLPRVFGMGFSLEVSIESQWRRLMTVWDPVSFFLDDGYAIGMEADFFEDVVRIVASARAGGPFFVPIRSWDDHFTESGRVTRPQFLKSANLLSD